MKSRTNALLSYTALSVICALWLPSVACGISRSSAVSSRKGRLYISWGYNRSAYTQSDIHFTGPDYDFTLHGVTAKDRPTKFDLGTYIDPTKATIPQYEFRVSYFISEHTSVSFGISHMKYVVTQDQGTNISGTIDSSVSPAYAGTYDFTSIPLNADFLRFEHTNGLNYEAVEVETLLPLLENHHKSRGLYFTTAVGAGILTPKSDVTLFNTRQKNVIHLAGYGFNGKLGLRFEFLNRLFIKAFTNFGYLNMPSILTRSGDTGDRASQHFYFIEGSMVAGVSLYTFD